MNPLPKDAVKEVVESRRQNEAHLAACPAPHAFVRMHPDKLICRLRCIKCGGIVDPESARWYNAGIIHGKELCHSQRK